MTINSPAAPIWAMYIVAAEKAGVPRDRLEGTTQNDILKEFVAQKEFLFPPEPSMRLVTDTIEFGTREMPRWNTVSISGYHIREAGSTAVQELAFTIADGMAYVEAALERGLRIDDFAPRLSFFFNSHSDFFEEIAKFRASRRIWHKLMTERYGAENERSAWMRFHTQTAGVSLTPQQPLNNLTRVALQALAGGAGRDAVAPHRRVRRGARGPDRRGRAARPSPAADHRRGERRRRHGRPARRVVVRRGADRRDRAARSGATSTRSTGAAGWSPPSPRATRSTRSPTRPTATSASSMPGERRVVGINAYVDEAEQTTIPVLAVPPGSEERHLARLERTRRERDAGAVEAALRGLRETAARPGSSETNLMPHFIRCAAAYATLGEQCARPARGLRGVPRAGRGLSAMYLDSLEFLEEERDAWAPVRGARRPDRRAARGPVADAHGWTGRQLMAHLVAWQENALAVATELAVNETSPTKARVRRRLGRARRRGRSTPRSTRPGRRCRWPRSASGSRTIPGQLRGYLTVVPETRWLKHADHQTFFHDETTAHYEEHRADLDAILAAAGDVTLRELLEEEAGDLPGVGIHGRAATGPTTWSRGGRPFAIAAADGSSAEFALDPAVADAAARTPDVTPLEPRAGLGRLRPGRARRPRRRQSGRLARLGPPSPRTPELDRECRCATPGRR